MTPLFHGCMERIFCLHGAEKSRSSYFSVNRYLRTHGGVRYGRSMTQRHPIRNDRVMLITTVTHERIPFFADSVRAREAVECLYRVQHLHPFFLHGFVVMPDHCHFLLNIPSPGTISHVMGCYKSGLTFDTGIPKLWQGRFHIRIVHDAVGALQYVHANPVKAGLSKISTEYPWSSASGKWPVTEFDFAFIDTR